MNGKRKKWLAVFLLTALAVCGGRCIGSCMYQVQAEETDQTAKEEVEEKQERVEETDKEAKETVETEQEEAAEVQEQAEEMILGELDFGELDRAVKEVFPKERITFEDLLDALLNGEETLPKEMVAGYVSDAMFYVLKANKSAMISLLLLVIAAAVFSNFSSIFGSGQVAQIGFYIVYMLLVVTCLQGFKATVQEVTENLGQLTGFMQVLSPVYFLAMAIAVGSVSAISFYQITLLLIYLVELFILHFLLPLIHVYLMLEVINFLSEEAYLTKLAELVQTLIGWSLKTLLAVVTGLGFLRGLIGPAVDAVKRSTLTKGAEMIPGVGDAISGVTEIILGTAVMLKSGIGVAGAVLVVGICLIPILNMGILTLLYRGMAALIQPISDKRIVELVNSVGVGCQMLLQVVFTTGVLFLITIAVAAAAAR